MAGRISCNAMTGDLLLTTSCPVGCSFCIYDCAKDKEWMPESTIARVAQEFARNDISIRIGGGEPFMDLEKLERCLEIVLKFHDPERVSLITSGYFAANSVLLQKAVNLIEKQHITSVLLSTDRFHQESIPVETLSFLVDELNKASVEVVLRATFDTLSVNIMRDIIRFAVKKGLKVNPHFGIMPAGRASALSYGDICSDDSIKGRYKDLVREEGRDGLDLLYEGPGGDILSRSRIYPVVFPGGNVFGDSNCTKSTFLGNIHAKDLSEMLSAFRNSFPGYYLENSRKDCSANIAKFFPPHSENICQFCMDHPIAGVFPSEVRGSVHLALDPKSSLDEACIGLEKGRRYLISFLLDESRLDAGCGKNAVNLLGKLRGMGIRFSVVHPLPRCMLGRGYTALCNEYGIPRNCFECNDLFRTEGLRLKSCNHIDSDGPLITEVEDRSAIFRIFDARRLDREPLGACKGCLHFRRKDCDGMCFRR